MQTELDALESKLMQLLEQHHVLRAENLKLRQQVVSQENANKQLTDRLAEARSRLTSLYDKLPD